MSNPDRPETIAPNPAETPVPKSVRHILSLSGGKDSIVMGQYSVGGV